MPVLPRAKKSQDTLTCESGRIEFRSTDFRALFLFVGKNSKTWYIKCWFKKKKYQIKIAPYDLLNYQNAIVQAQSIYFSIINGTFDSEDLVEKPSFSDFFREVYLPRAKQRKSSWRSDLSKFNTYLDQVFGSFSIDEIKQELIEQYLCDLDLKASTINKHLSLMSAIFTLALQMELIESNPAKGIRKRIENNERVAYFSERQSKAFDSAAQEDINEEAANLLLSLKKTGARLSELQLLTFDRINWGDKVIEIPVSKSGYARKIYLSDEVIGILEKQRKKYGSHGYVFRQKNGTKPIGHPRTTLERILKRIGMKASGFRVHDLRHDFCTRVLREGKGKVTLYHVGKLAGHRSLNSTKRYAHIADQELLSLTNLV